MSTDGYEPLYRGFDSPLARQLRREAYGEDIGQHSWVRADEVRADIPRLKLGPSSRLLDLGCGPCGPLTLVLAATGCGGTGVELSVPALQSGRERAVAMGVGERLDVRNADLNAPLPFADASFSAAMSLDVVNHLRDRAAFFSEVARLLPPLGRFLLTDAGIVTGALSAGEVARRTPHGFMQLVPEGWNERLLEAAGFRILEMEDRTESVVTNAVGRLAALLAHREEVERESSAGAVESQRAYLETVVALSSRRALSRRMFLAERRDAA